MRNFDENYSLVRILHAVEGDVVDVYLNGSPFANNVRFTEFTPYIYVPKGRYMVEVFPRDEKENPIVQGIIDITSCELMTVAIAGENDKSIEIIPIEEEMTIPTGNQSTHTINSPIHSVQLCFQYIHRVVWLTPQAVYNIFITPERNPVHIIAVTNECL